MTEAHRLKWWADTLRRLEDDEDAGEMSTAGSDVSEAAGRHLHGQEAVETPPDYDERKTDDWIRIS